MTTMNMPKPQIIIYRLMGVQVLLTLLLAVGFWIGLSGFSAYSVLIAGVVCVLANAFFTWRVFRHRGARAAQRFMIAFFLGELSKLFIQGALFVIALVYLKVAFGPFLISFVMNLMVFWFAPLMLRNQ